MLNNSSKSMLSALTGLFLYLRAILISFLGQAQEIIPYPNQYEKNEGTLIIPRKVSVSASASDEFADLIPVFIESAQKFDVQVKRKREKGFDYRNPGSTHEVE